MNLLYPNNPKERLTAILTEVNTLLTGNCDKYAAETESIYVATWNEVEQEYAAFAAAIEGGFGYSTHKIELEGHKKLIIIHEANCTNAVLNDGEMKAVILHELGHLLNFPELQREPTTLDVYQNRATQDQIKVIRETNLRLKEIYADAYTKQHGYSQESLEVFRKFNEWSGQKVGFCEERMAALNDYVGMVRPVDRNGF